MGVRMILKWLQLSHHTLPYIVLTESPAEDDLQARV